MGRAVDKINVSLYVLIPVYNCKQYLADAVNSVLRNQIRGIQIILVDDGSTDGSSELCDTLSEQHETISVIHQKNSGVSAARNAGIEYALSLCQGQEEASYLAFLDADDAWTSNFFDASVLDAMMQGYDLIGFLSCGCNISMTKRNEPTLLQEGIYTGGSSSIWIHASQPFCAMLYSCKLLSTYHLRFQTDLHYTEDKLFSMSALYLAHRILLQNKLMYLYRQNAASAMHTRCHGIPYFAPIIHGYLMVDKNMAPFQNSQREELVAGRQLACIYVMDMADEHFSHFGTLKAFNRFMQENVDSEELSALLNGEDSRIPANAAYQQLQQHPVAYVMKAYLKGVLLAFPRLCVKISLVKTLRDARRFPIAMNESTMEE